MIFFALLDINEMSSESRAPSQNPVNKLYINIASILSTVTDANLSTVSWNNSAAIGAIGSANVTIAGLLSTPGAAVLRDMGKTVYLPAGSTAANTSTMLRKVQLLVPGNINGIAGDSGLTGAGAGDYLTGYIQIGGMTYGGAGAGTSASNATNTGLAKVARLN
jgi:hypothetical protein